MATSDGKRVLALTLLLLDFKSNTKKKEKKMRKKKRIWTRSLLGKKGEFGVPVLQNELETDGQNRLKDLFHMDVEKFNHLLRLVTPHIAKQYTRLRPTISARERLSVTLQFLATGETFASLSLQYHMGRSTISGIVRDTCKALYRVLKDDYLKTPTTEEQWRRIARDFQERSQFPHCVGALDSKRINIRPKANSGSTSRDNKSNSSVVLLAAVNANCQFLYAQVVTQDSVSDRGVYAHSDLRRAIDQKLLNLPPAQNVPGTDIVMPYMFVADETFPLQENLMKPYPSHHLDHDQRIFNCRLSKARCVAENAFGILSSRWQILLSTVALDPDLVSQITLATLSLHNFLCEHAKDGYATLSIVDSKDEAHGFIPESCGNSQHLKSLSAGSNINATLTAKQQRGALKSYFVSPAGSVTWQEDMI